MHMFFYKFNINPKQHDHTNQITITFSIQTNEHNILIKTKTLLQLQQPFNINLSRISQPSTFIEVVSALSKVHLAASSHSECRQEATRSYSFKPKLYLSHRIDELKKHYYELYEFIQTQQNIYVVNYLHYPKFDFFLKL